MAPCEPVIEQLELRIMFGGFWALTNTWALMNRRRFTNPLKIALYGNSNRTLP